MAAHRDNLLMPFKRYHIGKVWRGENTQRGRYREFVQCDFDIVGTDSPAADLEIMLMMSSALKVIGAGETRIRFKPSGLFNRLLFELGLEGQTAEVLRVVDKRGKIGGAEVKRLLSELTGTHNTEVLLDFITPSKDNHETLAKMSALAGVENGAVHKRVAAILEAAEKLQTHRELILDPSITRGLDYYTGIVFETFLDDLPSLGSVCSGGRYNNLTGLFMKNPLSGVGASIGLDRLMAGLDELGRLEHRTSPTDILVIMLDEDLLATYHGFARDLRAAGLSVEVYPEAKKITAQFKYAEAGGIPLALIVGPEEAAAGTVNLKDLRSRQSFNGLTFSAARDKAVELGGMGL